jgi:DNA-binding NarL/FixJ family response regulator
MRQADRQSAPKADALPGCATPRTAETLRFRRGDAQAGRAVHGIRWRNAARTGAESPELFPNLTPRQSEVASLVALGWTNKQIARELGISPATVKNHVHEILTKLGVPRRSGVGWALA